MDESTTRWDASNDVAGGEATLANRTRRTERLLPVHNMRGPRGRRRTSLTATLILSLLLATMLALTVRSLQRSRHMDLLRDTENQPRYSERLAAQMDLPKKFVSQEKQDNLHETKDVEKTQSKLPPTATQSGYRTVRKGMDGTQNTGEGERNNLEVSSNSKESQLNGQKVGVEEEEEEGVVKKEGTELERGNVAGGTEGLADRNEEGVDEMEGEEIDKEIDQRVEERNQHVQNVHGAKSGKDEAKEEDLDREEEYNDGMERSGSSKESSTVDEVGVDLDQEKEAEKKNLGAEQDWQADKQRDKAEEYFEEDKGQNAVTEQANNEKDENGEGGEMERASQMKDNEGLQGSQNALDRNFDAQAIKAGIDSKETSDHQQPHWQFLKDNSALDGQQEKNANFATAIGENASDSAARMGQAGGSSAIAIGEQSGVETSKISDATTIQDRVLEDLYDEQYEEHYEDANNGFMKRKKRLEDEAAADQAEADASGTESERNSLDPEKLAKQQEEFDTWIKEHEAQEAAMRSQADKEASENKQVEMKPMGNNQSKPTNDVEVDEYDYYDRADENQGKTAADQILPGTQNAKENKSAADGGVKASQNDVLTGRENGDRTGASEIPGSERSVADTTVDQTIDQSNAQEETSNKETDVTNVGGEEEDENEGSEEDLQGIKEYVEI